MNPIYTKAYVTQATGSANLGSFKVPWKCVLEWVDFAAGCILTQAAGTYGTANIHVLRKDVGASWVAPISAIGFYDDIICSTWGLIQGNAAGIDGNGIPMNKYCLVGMQLNKGEVISIVITSSNALMTIATVTLGFRV